MVGDRDGVSAPPAEDAREGIKVSVFGANVTLEGALEVAQAMKDLAASLGAPVEIVSVQFQCDGCGLKRPDKPRREEGWTSRNGEDFCPACSADLPSGESAT